MTVYKSGEKWRAEVYVESVRVSGKSGFLRKTDAKKWHDQELVRFLKEGPTKEKPKFTMEELLQRYRENHLATITPGTRKRYEIDIRYRIEPFFRFMKLEKITPATIEDFKRKIRKSLDDPKSTNNCLHTLRAMLNLAVKWEMIEKSPYRCDSLIVPDYEYKWWDEKRFITRFLESAKANTRYYPVYLRALQTGMRYGEIVGLSVGALDFRRGRIRVNRQWLEKEKSYGPPKHKKTRWIDFDLQSELGMELKKAALATPDPDILFPTENGLHPCRSGLANKYFKRAIRLAGVPEISFHDLRRTFASWYMREFDNIWDLKDILGHQNINTTQQKYAHHSPRHRKQVLSFSQTPSLPKTAESVPVAGNGGS